MNVAIERTISEPSWLVSTPAPPCDVCTWRAFCAQEKTACRRFSAYVREEETSRLPTIPSRRVYRKIFQGRVA